MFLYIAVMWMNKGFRKEDKEEGKIKQKKSRGKAEGQRKLG